MKIGLSDNGLLAVGGRILDSQGGHYKVFVRPPGGAFEAPVVFRPEGYWDLAVGPHGTVAVLVPEPVACRSTPVARGGQCLRAGAAHRPAERRAVRGPA